MQSVGKRSFRGWKAKYYSKEAKYIASQLILSSSVLRTVIHPPVVVGIRDAILVFNVL
jgi:hypothetical protein